MAYINYRGVNNYMPATMAAVDEPMNFLSLAGMNEAFNIHHQNAIAGAYLSKFLKEEEEPEKAELSDLEKHNLRISQNTLVNNFIDDYGGIANAQKVSEEALQSYFGDSWKDARTNIMARSLPKPKPKKVKLTDKDFYDLDPTEVSQLQVYYEILGDERFRKEFPQFADYFAAPKEKGISSPVSGINSNTVNNVLRTPSFKSDEPSLNDTLNSFTPNFAQPPSETPGWNIPLAPGQTLPPPAIRGASSNGLMGYVENIVTDRPPNIYDSWQSNDNYLWRNEDRITAKDKYQLRQEAIAEGKKSKRDFYRRGKVPIIIGGSASF